MAQVQAPVRKSLVSEWAREQCVFKAKVCWNDRIDYRNQFFAFSFGFHMKENKTYTRNTKSVLFPREGKDVVNRKEQGKLGISVGVVE